MKADAGTPRLAELILPAGEVQVAGSIRRKALVIDEDRFISSLVEECLVALGLEVIKLPPTEIASLDAKDIELVVVDLNPRRDRDNSLPHLIGSRFPSAAVLAISANFCSLSIECAGELAKRLGVAKVLSKPFSCEVFSNTVRALVSPLE
ncbi:MAG: hypothetical protein ACKVQA_16700 [Burkholderiales bacterium]